MFDRGSWNHTQRRYGTRKRRSAIRRVLALIVPTIVIVAALAILTSAYMRRTTVTIAPSATPSIALASAGPTIAAAAQPQPALPTTAPRGRFRPSASRGRVVRTLASVAVRVPPVSRVRPVLAVPASGRRRGHPHAPSTPVHVANSAVVITAVAAPTSSAARAPRPRPAVQGSEPPSSVATYAQPAPPVPRPARPTTPPCYPGQLDC
jgi:hypothetical protein